MQDAKAFEKWLTDNQMKFETAEQIIFAMLNDIPIQWGISNVYNFKVLDKLPKNLTQPELEKIFRRFTDEYRHLVWPVLYKFKPNQVKAFIAGSKNCKPNILLDFLNNVWEHVDEKNRYAAFINAAKAINTIVKQTYVATNKERAERFRFIAEDKVLVKAACDAVLNPAEPNVDTVVYWALITVLVQDAGIAALECLKKLGDKFTMANNSDLFLFIRLLNVYANETPILKTILDNAIAVQAERMAKTPAMQWAKKLGIEVGTTWDLKIQINTTGHKAAPYGTHDINDRLPNAYLLIECGYDPAWDWKFEVFAFEYGRSTSIYTRELYTNPLKLPAISTIDDFHMIMEAIEKTLNIKWNWETAYIRVEKSIRNKKNLQKIKDWLQPAKQNII